MSLWDNIVDGANWLGGKIGEGFNWIGDTIQKGWQPIQNTFDAYNKGYETSEDYKKALENANQSLQSQNAALNNQSRTFANMQNLLNNQQKLNSQYTGNKGYQNALTQGMQGANMLSGKAGNEALQAARNSGMTKAQAAALGTGAASNAFGNNLMSQQNTALQSGMNAIGANQGLSGQYGSLASGQGNQAGMYGNQSGLYGNLANIAQSEAQRKYGNAANNIQTGINTGGAIGNFITNLSALSDERMKNIIDNVDHISKLAEDIGAYYYTYKNPEYPGADDKEHIGPVAQELEQNPITKDAVEEDENGIKHVNGERLALSEMAIISDLARRLADLEEENK